MPKVSALMPVYNTNLTYLKGTIESVLNQSFKDFEFLILNDSPQNLELENFILEYAKQDRRIKYFKNPQNLGISPSRNKLIDLAQGEFLAVIDHDDISVKERFEKEVAFLEENQNIGVVSTQATFATSEKTLISGDEIFWHPVKDDEIKITLMLSSIITHSASMIRKDILTSNNIRYNAFYTPCDDYKLFCDLIEFTEFAVIDEILLHKRNFDNTTNKNAKKMSNIHWAIVNMNKIKYPELFAIATIKGEDDVLNPTRYIQERKIRILGIPFLKITQNNRVTKYRLFNVIEIVKIQNI